MQPLEVISVGDVSKDVFLRLLDERVEVREEPSGRVLVLPYGEKVPFEGAHSTGAGGNAANAAVGFARLGLSVALVTHVGDDATGGEVIAALSHEGVDTRFVRVDAGAATNCNYVLWHGADRTILVHHERYDYHWPHLRPGEVPRWLYLSSVGTAAFEYYEQLADWLGTRREVRFAFQPGTMQIALGVERLAHLYRRADVLVCNREEAATISGHSAASGGGSPAGGSTEEMVALLHGLRTLGPRLAVVTDGPCGAWAFDGHVRLFVPALPDSSPPLDRTGAGDAFASALVAGLARGLPIGEALAWAPVNARSVVHELGAQAGLLGEKELRTELDVVPDGWGVVSW